AGGAWRWSRLLLPGVGVPGGFAGVEEGLVGAGLGGDEGFLVDGVAEACHLLAVVAELFATRADVAAVVAPVADAGAYGGDGDADCGGGEAGPAEEDLIEGPVGDGVEGLAGGEVKGEVVDHGFSRLRRWWRRSARLAVIATMLRRRPRIPE